MGTELTNEAYMTVSEVAAALSVDERTIQRYAKKLATDPSGDFEPLKNSQGGYMLTEEDVTRIKLTMQQNPHLEDVALMPKTPSEIDAIIHQGRQLEQERDQGRQLEIESDTDARLISIERKLDRIILEKKRTQVRRAQFNNEYGLRYLLQRYLSQTTINKSKYITALSRSCVINQIIYFKTKLFHEWLIQEHLNIDMYTHEQLRSRLGHIGITVRHQRHIENDTYERCSFIPERMLFLIAANYC